MGAFYIRVGFTDYPRASNGWPWPGLGIPSAIERVDIGMYYPLARFIAAGNACWCICVGGYVFLSVAQAFVEMKLTPA